MGVGLRPRIPPSLHPETRDAPELPDVVRDEDEVARQSLSRDQHVAGPDRAPLALQGRPQAAERHRRVMVERERRELGGEDG